MGTCPPCSYRRHFPQHDMVERAIRLDGTCTGEHGVGMGKIVSAATIFQRFQLIRLPPPDHQEYLEQELGTGTVHLMESVKRLIDPYGIMNPGKLYPNRVSSAH